MPINIQHDAASALKVGHENVSAGYVGHEQIYPNTVEISNFRFPTTNAGVLRTGNVPVGGAALSDDYNVEITGPIGATFELAGINTVNSGQFSNPYTLTSSPFRFDVVIGSNNVCDSSFTSPGVVITPTGSTQLASGINATQAIGQTAGPNSSSFTPSVSFSVTENSRVLTYVGGSPFFTGGSSWTVTATVGVDTTRVNYYTLGWYRGNGTTNTYGMTIANNAGSGTYTFSLTGGTAGYVRFHLRTYAISSPPNCYSASPFLTTSSNYYP
tara:strand:+ start:25 stop:834 length:810 start_codon:yes stop_codon:yes gene_type:complete